MRESGEMGPEIALKIPTTDNAPRSAHRIFLQFSYVKTSQKSLNMVRVKKIYGSKLSFKVIVLFRPVDTIRK